MLTLTDTATAVVKEIVARAGEAEAGGLRIAPAAPMSEDLAVTIVATPEAEDQVVEQQGARVFLAEPAALTLEDKTLDARVNEEGRVAFDLLPQTLE
ncbi:iron-sulfur cluster assembly accessory protein [Agromyces soli]